MVSFVRDFPVPKRQKKLQEQTQHSISESQPIAPPSGGRTSLHTPFAALKPDVVRFLVAACILSLPMVLEVLYLTHSNYLPQDDGAGFLMNGYQVYQRFRDAGFWEGIRGIYMIRGWRPVTFHLFLLPGLVLTGGRMYLAYCSAILFITGYTTLYPFVLLKEKLSWLSASIGAAFVTSLPLMLFLSVYFYTEIALPGLIIGVIYHLLKSNDFSNLKHTVLAALLSGLALCLRPDQALLMLAPVLIIAMGIAWRKERIDGKDLLLCCAVFLLAAAVFFSMILCAGSISFPTSHSTGSAFFLRIVSRFLFAVTAILALGTPLAFAAARKTGSTAYSLLGFTLVICVLPLVWFFSFALNLFEWMYQATVGDGAQNMGPISTSFWSNMWGLFDSSGSFLIFSACAVAVLGWAIRGDLVRVVADEGYERRAVSYLMVSASGPFVMLLLGANLTPGFGASGQAWRRLLGAFCVYILAFVMIGLQPGKRIAWRQCVAVSLLLTQTLATGMKAAGLERGIARYRTFAGVLEKPKLMVPEPNHAVIDTLNRLAQTETVSYVDIEGYTDVSVGGVLLLSVITPTKYPVSNDYLPTYGGPNDLPELARRFSHVVLAITPPMNGVEQEILKRIRDYRIHPDANSHRQADILELLYSGDLEKYRLQSVRNMVLGDAEVLFFRSLAYKQSPPAASKLIVGNEPLTMTMTMTMTSMTSKDNVAAARSGARAIATSSQTGFPVANLNDGTPAPWGSAEDQNDVYGGVVLPAPKAIQEFRITVFSPNNQQHFREMSVVAADAEGSQGPNWRIVRSRVAGERLFTKKITVPLVADGTVVRIEIDREDPNWKVHKIWGFACFSRSIGYLRNYLKAGSGVYVRELEMK